MKYIPEFEDFLNEGKKPVENFDEQEFIEYLEKELRWNGAQVSVCDEKAAGFITSTRLMPGAKLFQYTCMDGSSVGKYIKDAIAKKISQSEGYCESV